MVVIMISGKMGSGKSSLANDLQLLLEKNAANVYRTRFAKVLYEMHDMVRDHGRKYGLTIPNKNGTLLQQLGTEWMRNTIDENGWVKCLVKDVENAEGAHYVIIDDLRFENEFNAQFAPGTKVLRIRLEASKECRKARCDAWREDDTHASEVGLDAFSEENRFHMVVDTEHNTAASVLSSVYNYVCSHKS